MPVVKGVSSPMHQDLRDSVFCHSRPVHVPERDQNPRYKSRRTLSARAGQPFQPSNNAGITAIWPAQRDFSPAGGTPTPDWNCLPIR